MLGLNLITGAISAVGSYFTEGQKIKAAQKERKDELKTKALDAKLEQIKNSTESDIKMDETSRSTAGIMDDISFYIFLSPLVLCFYPPALPHIEAGFAAIETMPLWWQYAIGLMLVSVWGYRRLIIPIAEAVVKQWVGKKF